MSGIELESKTFPTDDKPVRLAKPQRCDGCGAMVIKLPCQYCQAKRAEMLGRQRRRLERRLDDPFDPEVQAALERVTNALDQQQGEKKRPKPK